MYCRASRAELNKRNWLSRRYQLLWYIQMKMKMRWSVLELIKSVSTVADMEDASSISASFWSSKAFAPFSKILGESKNISFDLLAQDFLALRRPATCWLNCGGKVSSLNGRGDFPDGLWVLGATSFIFWTECSETNLAKIFVFLGSNFERVSGFEEIRVSRDLLFRSFSSKTCCRYFLGKPL